MNLQHTTQPENAVKIYTLPQKTNRFAPENRPVKNCPQLWKHNSYSNHPFSGAKKLDPFRYLVPHIPCQCHRARGALVHHIQRPPVLRIFCFRCLLVGGKKKAFTMNIFGKIGKKLVCHVLSVGGFKFLCFFCPCHSASRCVTVQKFEEFHEF